MMGGHVFLFLLSMFGGLVVLSCRTEAMHSLTERKFACGLALQNSTSAETSFLSFLAV